MATDAAAHDRELCAKPNSGALAQQPIPLRRGDRVSWQGEGETLQLTLTRAEHVPAQAEAPEDVTAQDDALLDEFYTGLRPEWRVRFDPLRELALPVARALRRDRRDECRAARGFDMGGVPGAAGSSGRGRTGR